MNEQVQNELKSLDIGFEVIDIEIKRVQFNDKIMPQVFSRMASEQEAEAAKFEGQAKARQAEIIWIIEREVSLIISSANRDVQIIKGEADAEAASLYALKTFLITISFPPSKFTSPSWRLL